MTMVVSYGKLAPETSLLDRNANELAHEQDMLLHIKRLSTLKCIINVHARLFISIVLL